MNTSLLVRTGGQLAMLVLVVLCGAGCAPFMRERFEVRVRSAERVALENQGTTIVPQGSSFTPRPVVTHADQEYRAQRAPDGALDLEVPSTWAFGGPAWATVIDARGTASLHAIYGADPVIEAGMVTVPLCHVWSRGNCRSRLDLKTPSDNVLQLDRVTELPRPLAVPFGALGVCLGAIGALELTIEPRTTVREVVATGALTVGVASLVIAGLYLFVPARRERLVVPSSRAHE